MTTPGRSGTCSLHVIEYGLSITNQRIKGSIISGFLQNVVLHVLLVILQCCVGGVAWCFLSVTFGGIGRLASGTVTSSSECSTTGNQSVVVFRKGFPVQLPVC